MRKFAFVIPFAAAALVAATPAPAAVTGSGTSVSAVTEPQTVDTTALTQWSGTQPSSNDTGVSVPRSPSSARESTPLPDPNSMTLLSLGLVGLIFGRRIAARRKAN